jgi:hypothetical protein
MMLVKSLETRRRQEERERKRLEQRAEKMASRERKEEQRRAELEVLRELRKPADDMALLATPGNIKPIHDVQYSVKHYGSMTFQNINLSQH